MYMNKNLDNVNYLNINDEQKQTEKNNSLFCTRKIVLLLCVLVLTPVFCRLFKSVQSTTKKVVNLGLETLSNTTSAVSDSIANTSPA